MAYADYESSYQFSTFQMYNNSAFIFRLLPTSMRNATTKNVKNVSTLYSSLGLKKQTA